MSGSSYKASGVDIDAGNETVRRIKTLARGTFTPGVLSEIGSFGGLFSLAPGGWTDPVLVSSADGVGTKLKVAFMADRHDTIGQDLVNHCVNDVLVQGATPLFFLDYLATGRLSPDVAEQIVRGLATACRENGCALLGGETAEMPGFYADGEYDVAGFIVGAVERARLVDGRTLVPGDVLLGLPSVGLHTNGYSLARQIAFERLGLRVDSYVPELGETVGHALLRPHVSYLRPIRPLLDAAVVKGMAHITGGGLTDNVPRILPAGTAAEIRRGAWPVLPVFEWLVTAGQVALDDQYRAFNMGVGLVVAIAAADVARAVALLRERGQEVHEIGRIVAGTPAWYGMSSEAPPRTEARLHRLGVLVSGRGSNLQALIDAVARRELDASIAVVISNVAGAAALDRARAAGIETRVIPHGGWPSREAYDAAVADVLIATEVHLVCLAGFMRRLSPRFLERAPGPVLNIHPSLLPAFPGLDAPAQAIAHGVKVAGCTVHLVTAELDAGPIVAQAAVPVGDGDTPDTLAARILAEEHRLYPRAVGRVLAGNWRVDGRRFVDD